MSVSHRAGCVASASLLKAIVCCLALPLDTNGQSDHNRMPSHPMAFCLDSF